MSIKVSEPCPNCPQAVLPTDNALAVQFHDLDLVLSLWRYCCPACGWVWANAAQRLHNNRHFERAFHEGNAAKRGLW